MFKRLIVKPLVLLGITALLFACSDQKSENGWKTSGIDHQPVNLNRDISITLGDVDPDTPTSRMLKIRPLANYIAKKLGWPESRIKIRIAKSVEDISLMLTDGSVDFFIDSSFPSLLVRSSSNSKIILEALVNGERAYHSIILSSKDSGITSLSDLLGKKISLQERYSTSGYLLPASVLLQQNVPLVFMQTQGAEPPKDKVGFFFSGDEENTIAMIRNRQAAAGAISGTDYRKLPDTLKKDFIILARSENVPRKLVSVRNGFDPELGEKLHQILLSISDRDRREMISQRSWKWEFIALDETSKSGIQKVENMIQLINHLDSN